MSTTAFRTWQQRILGGVFTKAQCNQFAQVVYPIAHGQEPRGKRTNLTQAEAKELFDVVNREGMYITPEHEQAALKWMKTYGHRELGRSSSTR